MIKDGNSMSAQSLPIYSSSNYAKGVEGGSEYQGYGKDIEAIS